VATFLITGVAGFVGIEDSLADISRASEVLGFEPKVGFAERLQRALAWYRGNVR
jgi:nucleoside-diphosphate-sugar epimerase